MSYYPKRPVKSFQDLEVYQKTYNLAVEIVRRVSAEIARNSDGDPVNLSPKLLKMALEIPKLIAEAHSRRFGDPQRSVETLEEAMLACNLAVVYFEQFRDLVNQKIEPEFFEEQIKEYLRVRGKIMRLQRAWLKFMGERK